MTDITFSEKSVKNILRKIIKDFRNSETENLLVREVKQLFETLTSLRIKAGVKMYHSTRFAFIQEGSYFTTKVANELETTGQAMQKTYLKIKEIFNKLEKEIGMLVEDNLNYAVYFNDGNTIKRATMNLIPTVRQGSKKQLKTSGLQTFLKNNKNLEDMDIKILDIGKHFQSFIGVIQATYKGGKIPNRTISYGRLAEAFEMHLQSNLNHNMNDAPPWSYNEIWTFLKQATANVPWYLSGDVGGTQVKSVITGDVRLTSKAAFQDTLNFLNYLLNSNDDIELAVNNAYNVLVVQLYLTEENTIKDLAHQSIILALQSEIRDQITF